MEVNEELLIKAIEQAIASVAMEFDDLEYSENNLFDKQKTLILNEKNNNLIFRGYYI